MTRYGNDKELMPTFSPYGICQYSDAMLKHLPKNAPKKLKKQYLERRVFNSTTANNVTNLNVNKRITKFQIQLKNAFVDRIPLRYFTDIGKFPS